MSSSENTKHNSNIREVRKTPITSETYFGKDANMEDCVRDLRYGKKLTNEKSSLFYSAR